MFGKNQVNSYGSVGGLLPIFFGWCRGTVMETMAGEKGVP